MGFFSGIIDTIGSVVGGVGGLLSGGLGSVIGGGLSAAASYAGQSGANEMNRTIAREQMAFQRDLSSSAYQRATVDMQKAGLNPMLAYSQGGASTPSGASAIMQDPATPAVNSALSAVRNAAEVDNMHQTNLNIKSQTALNLSQAAKAKADANLSTATAAKTIAGQPEAETWSDIYKSIRSYTQPASSAAGNKEGGVMDRIQNFLKKLYPPDPKTGSYHTN